MHICTWAPSQAHGEEKVMPFCQCSIFFEKLPEKSLTSAFLKALCTKATSALFPHVMMYFETKGFFKIFQAFGLLLVLFQITEMMVYQGELRLV